MPVFAELFPLCSGTETFGPTFAGVASGNEYTSGIRPVCLYLPAVFGHVRGMATLKSRSTDAEVLAGYDDNASYEEDGSRAKAEAFITACRILRNRLPLSAGRGSQTFIRESLQAEIEAAQRWKDALGAMEMAREMTRNNPLVMPGVRRLVANVVGRGFVLDSDSGDKAIDDVNGYRWESVIRDR